MGQQQAISQEVSRYSAFWLEAERKRISLRWRLRMAAGVPVGARGGGQAAAVPDRRVDAADHAAPAGALALGPGRRGAAERVRARLLRVPRPRAAPPAAVPLLQVRRTDLMPPRSQDLRHT